MTTRRRSRGARPLPRPPNRRKAAPERRTPKKKPAAKAALLSFEDDEADADVFQVKKSKEKKKSMRAPDARLADTQPCGLSGGRGVFVSGASRAPRSAEKLRRATVGAPGSERAGGDQASRRAQGDRWHRTAPAALAGSRALRASTPPARGRSRGRLSESRAGDGGRGDG